MKRMTLICAAAVFTAASAAFSQMEPSSLNKNVYSQGMNALVSEGFNVRIVEQDRDGNLTFKAQRPGTARTLVLDPSGQVVSDTTAPADGAVEATNSPFRDSE